MNGGETKLDNRWAVPYNIDLLKKFKAYINVEWCANRFNVLEYIFKVVLQGTAKFPVPYDVDCLARLVRDPLVRDSIYAPPLFRYVDLFPVFFLQRLCPFIHWS